MNNLRKSIGMEFCTRSFDSSGDGQGGDGKEVVSAESQGQKTTKENDQICLTRLTDRGMEAVSIGATEEMVEPFIQGSATEPDKEGVRDMLEAAIGQDLSHLSGKELGIIGKLLELSRSIEVIKKILALDKVELTVKYLVEAFEMYPELLENKKITPELWKRILPVDPIQLSLILMVLGDSPELLKNEAITLELWEQILLVEDPYYILDSLAKDSKKAEKLTEFLSQILLSRDPVEAFKFLEEHLELMKNAKIVPTLLSELRSLGLLDQIIFSKKGDPVGVLKVLGEYAGLLKNEKIRQLLYNILQYSYCIDVLRVLGKHLDLLKNIGLEILEEILFSDTWWRADLVFSILEKYPELLQNEKITKLLGNRLMLEKVLPILKKLGEQSELLKHEKMTDELWNKILSSPCFASKLEILGAHVKLLDYEKMTHELLDKILSSGYYNYVLEALSKYPGLLNNESLTPDLWDKILSSRNSFLILRALGKYPALLNNVKGDFWDKIYSCYRNLAGILDALGAYPELLESVKTALWDKIENCSDAGQVLEVLGRCPELLNENMTEHLSLVISLGRTSAGVLDVLKKYPELLKNLTAKLLGRILDTGKAATKVLEVLGKHSILLRNEKVMEILGKILEAKDYSGIFDVLSAHSKLLKNDKLTSEYLEKLMLLDNFDEILQSIDKGIVKNPNLLDMPADIFIKMSEKILYLALREDSRLEALLSKIKKEASIDVVEIQLNAIISSIIDSVLSDLTIIQNPIVFQLERSKRIAQLLVNTEGNLNLLLIDELKAKVPKSASPSYDRELDETLDSLKNNRKLSSLLRSTQVPTDSKNIANAFIRSTLRLGVDALLTIQQVRQAMLSALLMELRQDDTSSCFVAGVAIRIHNTQQERFLQDMKDMIENGYMQRSLDGIEYKLFWSTIPEEEIEFEDPFSSTTERNTLAGLQALGYGLAKAQKIYKTYIEKSSQLSPKNPKDLIESLAAIQLGITPEVMNARRKLEGLDKPDEMAIPILSSRIKIIDTKFAEYDNLINYAKLCFTSVSHNLLLKGWEYALGTAGKINPSSGEEKRDIYELFWGESDSTYKDSNTVVDWIFGMIWGDKIISRKHYGIDTALVDLTDEILKVKKSLSEEQGASFKQKLCEVFRREFEKLFFERVKIQYRYGGYSLYEAWDLRNLNEVQMISPLSDPIKLQDLLGRIILETGFKLRESFGREYSKLIIKIATGLSQYVRSNDFFEHYIRSISNKIEKEDQKIKPSDKIPDSKELKPRFKALIEGGSAESILKIYYESSSIGAVRIDAKSAEDLLVGLISAVRKLNIDKNDQKLMIPLVVSGLHGFLLMPNHSSFRSAIDSNLDAQEWVDQYMKKEGTTVVFSDSDWEFAGERCLFAFNKNLMGDIVFSSINERGLISPRNQEMWVKDKTFNLYTGVL